MQVDHTWFGFPVVSFEGLSLIGCRNISNKVWRELLLFYAGQQMQSAIKGKGARSNSVSELIQPSKTTWVAGLEISVHIFLLWWNWLLTFTLNILPGEVRCSISGKHPLEEEEMITNVTLRFCACLVGLDADRVSRRELLKQSSIKTLFITSTDESSK